jgi:hypothetical protein
MDYLASASAARERTRTRPGKVMEAIGVIISLVIVGVLVWALTQRAPSTAEALTPRSKLEIGQRVTLGVAARVCMTEADFVAALDSGDDRRCHYAGADMPARVVELGPSGGVRIDLDGIQGEAWAASGSMRPR